MVRHDDVIKWKHFTRYWLFVRGIHRWLVNSPHKGQWRGAFMFSLICAWINGCANSREAGDLRRHRAYYDVIVMVKTFSETRVTYRGDTILDVTKSGKIKPVHAVTPHWRLNSAKIRLFVQQLTQARSKENINAPDDRPFARGIYPWLFVKRVGNAERIHLW